MARLRNEELSAEARENLKAVPMTVEFACDHAHVRDFWALAGLSAPD
jgi:hypothetical protein